MSTIFIDLDRTGNWFVFTSPYNEAFVHELKSRVPAKFRRWAPEQRAWCVARERWSQTEKLLRKHYGRDMEFEVGPAAEAAQLDLMVDEIHEPSAHDYVRIGVRADAPDCVVHAAFYALETLWASTDAYTVRRMGVAPLDEIRTAYERVCALRGLHDAVTVSSATVPSRVPEPRQHNATPPPMEDVPPPTDNDYYPHASQAFSPGLATYTQPDAVEHVEFHAVTKGSNE